MFGRPGGKYTGIQCKKKDSWPPVNLTTAEIDEEIAKAKTWTPALEHYIIATTAPNDQKVQGHVRAITEAHEKTGLFSVEVASWDEITRRLADHPDILRKYGYVPNVDLAETIKLVVEQLLSTGGIVISREAGDILDDAERELKSTMAKIRQRPTYIKTAWEKDKSFSDQPSPAFWINEVLDPLHGAMKGVHAIYTATFAAVRLRLDAEDPASLKSAIDLLSARHAESSGTRQDLHALRGSIEKLPGTPEEIKLYLKAIEKYFFEATMTAVRTPMRTLLEKLQNISKGAISESQIESVARELQKVDIGPAAEESVNVVLGHVEQMWPLVLSGYYDARLRVLRRAEHRDEVSDLLKRRKRLARNLAFVPDEDRLEAIVELKGIDASLEELTG